MQAPRSVTLVAGPPCAGKSTYVNARRGPGDVVADFDEVAQAIAGGHTKWAHSRAVGDAAERAMLDLVDQVAALDAGTAWVIRCCPDPWARAWLAHAIGATRVVVLLPPLGVLMERARERPLAGETTRAIWRWRDAYAPAECDELVRG